MFAQLKTIMKKPALYENGTADLWTDEHISKGMLEAHLHPDWDAATRKHATVREAVKWISAITPAEKYRYLLDLGCGPGIYAEEFHKSGYHVTGMDFSERSINYARNSAQEKKFPIAYHHQDCLALDFRTQFDLATLIYYWIGNLSAKDREKILKKIHTALKPGGLFIFEVLTPQHFADKKEHHNWEYEEKGGFFNAEPHINLHSFYRYDEQNTFCDRHIVVTEQKVSHINIWEHAFTKDEIMRDLKAAGFNIKALYGNMEGADYCTGGKEICIVAQKGGNYDDGI